MSEHGSELATLEALYTYVVQTRSDVNVHQKCMEFLWY